MTAPVAPSRASAPHLTPSVVAALHRALVEARDAQLALVRELDATAEVLFGQHDADSVQERQIAEQGAARSRETIAEIELALRRLDEGTYGQCERCGGEISLARLEVVPHARHCVACPAPPRLLS